MENIPLVTNTMFQSLKFTTSFHKITLWFLFYSWKFSSFICFQKAWFIVLYFPFCIFLLVFELYRYLKAFVVRQTILAILQNDFSADFSKHKSFKIISPLFQIIW
jgi:hypothetical protein